MVEKDWAAIFGSEFDYIRRLGGCISDPEEKRAFWETVKEKKTENPRWSIYEAYPPASDGKRVALKYSGEILEMLRGRKKEESDVG